MANKYKHSVVNQAFLDLAQCRERLLQYAIAHGHIPADKAQEIEQVIGNAAQVLQSTLLRAKRILDEGATD